MPEVQVQGKFAQVVMPSPDGVEPQPMTVIVLDTFQAEYTRKDEDVLYHLFRKEQSAWPQGFEQVVWDVFLDHYKLKGREGQLTVEWVNEVFSWCVTVEKVARFVVPDRDMLENPLRRIDLIMKGVAP